MPDIETIDDYDPFENEDAVCSSCGRNLNEDTHGCPDCGSCGGVYSPGTEECDWCGFSADCAANSPY